ncbi:MAG: MoxR family ATPase [Planctomycetes bacterium]|nr:MoxR family ATPase [Planctomycetota bacterium]
MSSADQLQSIRTSEDVRAACEAFRVVASRLREEIGRVLVGQEQTVTSVLVALFSNGHVLLEGVPGLGKTLLVRTLGQALGLRFSRVQFTPDLMPADIIGTQIVLDDPRTSQRQFAFRPGPIFTQILLADEINRASPKSQSALLEAMQERSITVGGTTHKLEQPFLVLATQNPIEQEGTYPLPEAQLDRFLIKVIVPPPERDSLNEIIERTTGVQSKDNEVKPVLSASQIAWAQGLARLIVVAPHVQDYAVRLTLATQPGGAFSPAGMEHLIAVGASPRGAQALMSCAKVLALLGGRAAVSTQDIAAAAMPALRHRVVRSFEAEAAGVTTDALVQQLIDATPRELQAAGEAR